MMAALADYRLVWHAAVAPSILRRIVWGMLALVVVGVALFGPGTRPSTPTLLIGIPVLSLILLYWMELAPGAARQLTPANARLVPRLRRRAMQLVGAWWLAAVCAIAVAMGNAFGNPMLWALAGGMWLAGAAGARTGASWGNAVIYLPFMWGLFPGELLRTISALAGTWAGAAACAALLLAVAWYGMRSVFPRGDRHFAQRAAMAAGLTTMAAENGVERMTGQATPGRWYARSLSRATSARGSAGELLLHALGPAARWSDSMAAALVALGVGIPFAIFLRLTASEDTLTAVSAVSSFVMLPLVYLFASGPRDIVRRFGATQGEQGLVRLSPLVPDMDRLNRVLAVALLRRALLEWLIVSATLLSLSAAFGGSFALLLLQLAICCMALPCVSNVLRDYARSAGWGPDVAAVALVFAGALAGGIMAMRVSPAFAAGVLFAIAAPLSALVIGWRARRMLRAPLAIPAGRLAR